MQALEDTYKNMCDICGTNTVPKLLPLSLLYLVNDYKTRYAAQCKTLAQLCGMIYTSQIDFGNLPRPKVSFDGSSKSAISHPLYPVAGGYSYHTSYVPIEIPHPPPGL